MSLKGSLRREYHRLGLRRLGLDHRFRRLEREWRRLQADAERDPLPPDRPEGPTRIVLLTAAPSHFNKSKGDEAMMGVVLGHLRQTYPDCEIHALTLSDEADLRARDLGCIPLRMYGKEGLGRLYREYRRIRPDYCFAVGADVMDGSYSQLYSLRVIALTDLAARLGAQVSIFGFSFSKAPHPGLSDAFAQMKEGVQLNLRDPVSYERFRRFTRAPARQVADLAFQLRSDTESSAYREERDWIASERAAGRRVIGLNIHPSIMPLGERDRKLPQIVELAADILGRLTAERDVSVLLIVHDHSEDVTCARVLGPLDRRFRERGATHTRLLEREASAAELRAAVGDLDGVVSARMHLAIAALGQGIPVMGINYKDKMEGLFALFSLDETVLLPATRILDPGALESGIDGFLENMDEYRETVQSRLPDVRRQSAMNFDISR